MRAVNDDPLARGLVCSSRARREGEKGEQHKLEVKTSTQKSSLASSFAVVCQHHSFASNKMGHAQLIGKAATVSVSAEIGMGVALGLCTGALWKVRMVYQEQC